MRAIQTIVIGILVSLIFWNMGNDRQGVNGKAGLFFFMSMNQTMASMYSVLLTFIIERPIFLREYSNKMYGLSTYFISKSVIEAPFQLIFPIVISFLMYFTTGLTWEIERFSIFVLVMISVVFCSTSVGFFIG